MGMRPWGYMHAGAMEVGVRRKAVMGMRPCGYMHAGAMEVGVWRKAVMGMRAWGYMQEEVRRRKEGRKEWDFNLKSNHPSNNRKNRKNRNSYLSMFFIFCLFYFLEQVWPWPGLAPDSQIERNNP